MSNNALSHQSGDQSDQDCVGKLVGIHGLQMSSTLNGRRGRLGEAHGSERWQVQVIGRLGSIERTIAVKPDNLYLLDEQWVRATSTRSFNQPRMLGEFKAPAMYPPPFGAMTRSRHPPSPKQVADFWGPECFAFMEQKLPSVMEAKRKSNKGAGVFNWVTGGPGSFKQGVVFGDGHLHTQTLPIEACPHQHGIGGQQWWPVLWAPVSEGYGARGCTTLAVWCQAQAMLNGRPWATHSSRVFDFSDPRPTAPVRMTFPGSTVTIEELPDSDDESDESDESDETETTQTNTIDSWGWDMCS